jgi:hypothetical protein
MHMKAPCAGKAGGLPGALALITPVHCRDPDAKLIRIARCLE